MPPKRPAHCFGCPEASYGDRLITPEGYRVAGCAGPLVLNAETIAGIEITPGVYLGLLLTGPQEAMCRKGMPQALEPPRQSPHTV